MQSIGDKIINGAAWSAFTIWGRHAAIFAVFVIVARHLGPEAFGLAGLATVVPSLLALPVTRGIPEALIQRAEIDPIHFDSAFWLLSIVGLILTALSWAFAGIVAAAFGQPLLEELVRWTSIIIVIQALAAVPAAVLKRQLNFRFFALGIMAGTLAGGLLGIGMAVSGFGVWSIISMQIANAAVETSVLLLFGAWRPRLCCSYARFRELFSFAAPIVAQSFWTILNDELPKVLLGKFLGTYAVGVYVFARRPLDLLVQACLHPLMLVVMPGISRFQDNPEKIDRFFDRSVRLAGLIGFPTFMGFAAIAPEAVPQIFGEDWRSAVLPVQILLLVGLVKTIDIICGGTVLALGHASLILKLNIAYTILGAILITAATWINLEATMAAIVFCNLVLAVIFLFFTQRLGSVDVLKPLAMFPRLAVATLLMFISVTAWRLIAEHSVQDTIVVAGAIVIGAVVYGMAAIILIRPDVLAARNMLLKLRGQTTES